VLSVSRRGTARSALWDVAVSRGLMGFGRKYSKDAHDKDDWRLEYRGGNRLTSLLPGRYPLIIIQYAVYVLCGSLSIWVVL